ncbi:PREDICTED: putative nuclease HARBI1 isoform X2 [Vollenhovia emeryi]|uniref:putative nuclease HARBI1 isoform X2 n=1 Tax=Vollenhovia emeryi TaxID=411798 RepID=UPI0005F4CFBC|nr:PREDICTED: putative nuclease HARBI1 isoform X2 [Vollenhovia emeryi]
MEDNLIDPAPQRIAILNGITMILMELLDFSSSESEEEEEELEHVLHIVEKRKKLPRLENYVENVVPAYSDLQFKSHFRISRGTFEFILNIIAPRLKRTCWGMSMISPEKQFLIAVWRMATPDSYRSICEKFNVSRATALSATRRVVRSLYHLAPTVIKWPSGNNVREVWTGFEATSSFPKVIGAIDGTRINIPAPCVEPASYVNRKGHHSIQLQCVTIKHTSHIAL